MLLEGLTARCRVHLECRENAHEHLFETLEVPVLIDDGVDDTREENLLRFVSEQIHQVVHLVNCLKVQHVLLAPLGQQLFTKQIHKVLDILVVRQVHVLAWVRKAHLYLVHQRAAHRNNHRLHSSLLRIH